MSIELSRRLSAPINNEPGMLDLNIFFAVES
jgi:hypothetical protein